MLAIFIFYFSTIVTKEIFYIAWDPESVILTFIKLLKCSYYVLLNVPTEICFGGPLRYVYMHSRLKNNNNNNLFLKSIVT